MRSDLLLVACHVAVLPRHRTKILRRKENFSGASKEVGGFIGLVL